MRHFSDSLTFKIGVTIILVEAVALAITGFFYIDRFKTQIDERVRARVELPGMLVGKGLLNFGSIADENVMRELVGEELVDGLVVGADKRVFYALNPDYAQRQITEFMDIEPGWFDEGLTKSLLEETADGLVGITPIRTFAREKSAYFVYIKVGTGQAEREKKAIVELFVFGSTFSLVITSLIVILSFRFSILTRITDTLNVLGRAEAGDLTARIRTAISKDEIGDLQGRVNSMIAAQEQRIEERTQAEEALRESEEMYRTLLSNLNAGVVVHAPDTAILLANSTACTLLGLTEKQMLGMEAIDPQWKFLRDDGSAMPLDEYPVTQVLSTQEFLRNLVVGVNCPQTDDVVWVLVNGFPVTNDSGEIEQIIITFIDITERKLAEEALKKSETEYKSTLHNLLTGVVVHAADTSIVLSNPEAHNILGITEEQMTGKKAIDPAWNFVYEDLTNMKIEDYPVHKVISTKKPLHNYIFGIKRPDRGYVTWVNVNAIPLFSEHGDLEKTIVNFVDITAIKQIQAVVAAKNKELENYLYVASHDLRSPLVNIQGFSQRLQKQTNSIAALLAGSALETGIQQNIDRITGEGIPKSLDFILTNVAKMDRLINGLLHISRTGQVKMSIHKIDMNSLLANVMRALSFQIEDADAQVVVDSLPECYGDAGLLDQLFTNIIGNALKYRDTDRRLMVTITAQTQYNNVVYRIHDTGIGIVQRHLDKIWDVFYQVDFQSPEAGDGIGLSIVKRIVDKHKGKISVESEEGQGSAFSIELPVHEFSE